ncbi:polysaccharide deacetylase family protein [Halosaccharopolyspora lacisalsi]|uniref:polysaccharide deacetylase family protein n=1 Tax=Halosaccharopolyspora lacisalsi TaxID=1000566 RepID=UPI0038B2AA1E
MALAFDDGPDPRNTPHLLDVLRPHQVKAVFRLWGEHVKEHPELVGGSWRRDPRCATTRRATGTCAPGRRARSERTSERPTRRSTRQRRGAHPVLPSPNGAGDGRRRWRQHSTCSRSAGASRSPTGTTPVRTCWYSGCATAFRRGDVVLRTTVAATARRR